MSKQINRRHAYYNEVVKQGLVEKFGYKNVMEVPKIDRYIEDNEIIKVGNNILQIKFDKDIKLSEFNFVDRIGNKIMNAYWSIDNVPTYAKLNIKNRKFIWRKLLMQSELNNNYSLFQTPFTNGRLYMENNINLFLKRQDPFGKYGLSNPIYKDDKVVLNPFKKFIIKGYEPYNVTTSDINFKNFDNCY